MSDWCLKSRPKSKRPFYGVFFRLFDVCFLMHGSIKRAEVMELCRITKDQAYKVLNRLKNNGKIRLKGERKSAFYERQR